MRFPTFGLVVALSSLARLGVNADISVTLDSSGPFSVGDSYRGTWAGVEQGTFVRVGLYVPNTETGLGGAGNSNNFIRLLYGKFTRAFHSAPDAHGWVLKADSEQTRRTVPRQPRNYSALKLVPAGSRERFHSNLYQMTCGLAKTLSLELWEGETSPRDIPAS